MGTWYAGCTSAGVPHSPDFRIFDAHTHLSGKESGESAENILGCLDSCGVNKAFVIAPLLEPRHWQLSAHNAGDIRRNNDYCATVCSRDPERLIGLAVLNPAPEIADGSLERAVDLMIEEARRCRHELGFRGVKLVPSGWYPNDPQAIRLYRELADLRLYVLFHSGIFLNGREGSYCRPTFFEVVHQVPKLRAQLAHVGWPWVDECVAVLAMESQIHGKEPERWQLRADVSFGPPDDWQLETWQHALDALPKQMLCYGSDVFWPCDAERYREQYLLPQLGLFEVATTNGHHATEGSPARTRLRQQIFYDNVWSHWQAAVGETEPARRPVTPARPRATQGNGR